MIVDAATDASFLQLAVIAGVLLVYALLNVRRCYQLSVDLRLRLLLPTMGSLILGLALFFVACILLAKVKYSEGYFANIDSIVEGNITHRVITSIVSRPGTLWSASSKQLLTPALCLLYMGVSLVLAAATALIIIDFAPVPTTTSKRTALGVTILLSFISIVLTLAATGTGAISSLATASEAALIPALASLCIALQAVVSGIIVFLQDRWRPSSIAVAFAGLGSASIFTLSFLTAFMTIDLSTKQAVLDTLLSIMGCSIAVLVVFVFGLASRHRPLGGEQLSKLQEAVVGLRRKSNPDDPLMHALSAAPSTLLAAAHPQQEYLRPLSALNSPMTFSQLGMPQHSAVGMHPSSQNSYDERQVSMSTASPSASQLGAGGYTPARPSRLRQGSLSRETEDRMTALMHDLQAEPAGETLAPPVRRQSQGTVRPGPLPHNPPPLAPQSARLMTPITEEASGRMRPISRPPSVGRSGASGQRWSKTLSDLRLSSLARPAQTASSITKRRKRSPRDSSAVLSRLQIDNGFIQVSSFIAPDDDNDGGEGQEAYTLPDASMPTAQPQLLWPRSRIQAPPQLSIPSKPKQPPPSSLRAGSPSIIMSKFTSPTKAQAHSLPTLQPAAAVLGRDSYILPSGSPVLQPGPTTPTATSDLDQLPSPVSLQEGYMHISQMDDPPLTWNSVPNVADQRSPTPSPATLPSASSAASLSK
ncbi:hypothetical protein RI367_003195 [Sorochytrium milnesiophthora]